jgi:DNA repair exonuclease SbcCD nuclease subunit
MADCHIGSWRDPKLKDVSTQAFVKAIDSTIAKQVDFIIIAGDLFNTSFPRLDNLKVVVQKFKQLKDLDIPVYIVPGSHDYSPSGRTMLDVLEEAGLFVNVFKGSVQDGKLHLRFTIDKKTGAKITGMLGKMGALERKYYEHLEQSHLEQEKGYKIFIFHSGLEEFKPSTMEKLDFHPLSLLPKHFDYYAGGHVHYVFQKEEPEYGLIAYPGPLFPNSFGELEKLERGGFYIVENGRVAWEPIQIHNTFSLSINCNHLTPEQVKEELLKKIKDKEFINTIVMIRLFGSLASGKPSDIDLKEIFDALYSKSAYFVMKNTAALTSKEFEEIKIDAGSVEQIESGLLREHLGQVKVEGLTEKEEDLIRQLMAALNTDKNEGETVADFSKRVKEEAKNVLRLDY